MFAGKLNDVLFKNDISQPKTNHSNSYFSFIKIRVARFGTILFEKCTAQTLIMHNKSVNYIKFNETISPVKLFGASLNRSSGIN